MNKQNLYVLFFLSMTLHPIFADDFDSYNYPIVHFGGSFTLDNQVNLDVIPKQENNGFGTISSFSGQRVGASGHVNSAAGGGSVSQSYTLLQVGSTSRASLNVVSDGPVTKSECRQYQKQMTELDLLYKQQFGQGYNTVENMMNKNNHDFVQEILNSKYPYYDEQIVALWSEYNRRGRIKNKNKAELEKKINDELKFRHDQRVRVQAQQEAAIRVSLQNQEKEREANRVVMRLSNQKEILQQRMSQLGLDPDQCIYLPKDFESVKQEYGLCKNVCSQAELVERELIAMQLADAPVCANGSFRLASDIWSIRQQAIKRTVDQGFAQGSCTIDLSSQTQGYLISKGLRPQAYGSFFGTTFQQELHSEVCRSFDLLARAELNSRHKSSFFNFVAQCSDASFWANSFEAPLLAMSLLDLSASCFQVGCWAIENGPVYLQAMGEGVVESAWDFAYIASHPIQTVTHIGQAAYFVMETLALYNPELRQEYPETFEPLRQARQQLISSMASVAMTRLSTSTGPERVKAATKLVADCVFQHKALQALGAVTGVLRSNVGTIRTAEFVADIMSSEPELALAGEVIAQATADIETVVQKSLQNELAPIGNSLEKAGIVAAEEAAMATRSIFEILINIEKIGGKIPLSNIELCQEVRTFVKQAINETKSFIDSKLRQNFSSKWTFENGIKTRVNIDLEHVLNYNCEFIENIALGHLEVKFKGGHLSGSSELLASKGVITIVKSKPLTNGCIEYTLRDTLSNDLFYKTEFPANWSSEKLIKSCWEIYENPAIPDYIEQAPKLIREGITSDGFKMSIVLKKPKPKLNVKLEQSTINIVTALPFAKKI